MKLLKLTITTIIVTLVSCTKDVHIVSELNNVDKNITIVIKKFPPEPIASTQRWERDVFIYSGYEDFISKENPVLVETTPGLGSDSEVTMKNINHDTLYLRVTLWEIFFNINRIEKGGYYYNDNIVIPEYNSDILVNTTSGKWIKG